jgi:phosphate starvation-inducible protein PhoH
MKALRPTGGLMLRRDSSGLPWGGNGEMLTQVERILPGIDGIGFHYFTDVDVVRHRLVRDIVRAYAADSGE